MVAFQLFPMSINSSGTPSANWGFGDQGVVFPAELCYKDYVLADWPGLRF